MRRHFLVTVVLVTALALPAAPAAAGDPVATDPCGDETPTPPAPAWDLAGLDADGVYQQDQDGASTLTAVELTFRLCGDVAERPAPSAYLLDWSAAGSPCTFRLHVSDGPTDGLQALVKQICPHDPPIGWLGFSRVVLSDRVPEEDVTVDGGALRVRLALDGALARLQPAHVHGTVLTDVRALAGAGVVVQDGDTIQDSTVGSYPFHARDRAEGREVTLGEDGP